MNYSVIISGSALKAMNRMPEKVRFRVDKKILSLSKNPLPRGVKKLRGSERFYRIRTGQYRVVYQIDGDQLRIIVIRIRHRKDVYR